MGPSPQGTLRELLGLRAGGGLGSMTASPQEEQGEWGPSSPKAPLQELFTTLGTGLQEWTFIPAPPSEQTTARWAHGAQSSR